MAGMNLKKEEPLTFIDLFAGIGGFRIALERVGCKCVFTSEIDEACRKMYLENFGDLPVGDITLIDENEIPDHDILCAGFPCQAFSIIGNGNGFTDTRGTLFFDVERILAAKRPKAFILENVKNLVSHDKGRTFEVITSHLKKLDYHIHWKILNGLNFGVPQKRERIIIVGFLKNKQFKFPEKGLGKNLTLSDILEPDEVVDKKYFASEYIVSNRMAKVKKVPYETGIWHENVSGNIGVHPHSCALRANGSYNYLLVNGKRRLTEREMLRLQGFPDNYKIVVGYSELRKQAGNSVVVPKIEAVAANVVKALKTPDKIRIDEFD